MPYALNAAHATGQTITAADENAQSAAINATTAGVYNVKEPTYGAVGDGTTDDAAAIQAAINAASAAGAVCLFPPATYVVGTGLTVGSNVTLLGYGATLKLTDPGVFVPTLKLSTSDNVRIRGLTCDGNLAAFTGVVTEHKHGIELDGATNVVVADCHTFNTKGDGFYLDAAPGGSGTSYTPSSNVTVVGCHFDTPWRDCCSIICAKRVRFFGCDFTNAAQVTGGGTSPKCALDVEPDVAGEIVADIAFVGCQFAGAAVAGITFNLSPSPTVPQGGLRFVGCDIASNTTGGVGFNFAYDCHLVDCNIHDNGGQGVSFSPGGAATLHDISILGGSVFSNATHGIDGSLGGLANAISGLKVIGVNIHDNGTSAANTYQGLTIFNGTFNDVLVMGCTSSGAQQARGFMVNNNSSLTALNRVRFIGNDARGNTTANYEFQLVPQALYGNGNFVTNNAGTSTQTPGAVTTVTIAHGLALAPTTWSVVPANAAARGAPASYVTADATNLTLAFASSLTAATSYAWTWGAERV